MTDRYTELVKQAYEAQQAISGDAYVKLTSDLTTIDAELETLSAKREATVAALEAMDDNVEAAKEALDAYFAGREEDDCPRTADHLFEHDEDELGPKQSLDVPSAEAEPGEGWGAYFRKAGYKPYEPDASSEFETAKANGALTD